MARVNVYLPDELAEAARAADLNISQIAQSAIRQQLQQSALRDWLEQVSRGTKRHVSHADVLAALDAVREESGTRS
ncbi:MAG TPA: type II toxin-antitoxin system CcdA family antitoxin [Candidatus Dormibacteraeota bacterium]|nr:type II toxin-antitoxin system CcdA family antitoxin [Candidatus Dormibacteraeota bacterium]